MFFIQPCLLSCFSSATRTYYILFFARLQVLQDFFSAVQGGGYYSRINRKAFTIHDRAGSSIWLRRYLVHLYFFLKAWYILRMKKILITILKPFSFAPAIAMMAVIYFFSAQTGDQSGQLSLKVSYDIVEVKNDLMGTQLTEDQLWSQAYSIHHYVRKAAHVTEYLILAVCVSFPLYIYGVRGIWLILLSGFICTAFAGFDEYHQSFVSNRGASPKDVAIDSIGVAIGILLVQSFCWSASHNPARGTGKRRKKAGIH